MNYRYVRAKTAFRVNRDYILPYDKKYASVYQVHVGELFKIKVRADFALNEDVCEELSKVELLILLNKNPRALDEIKEML